MSVMGIVFSIFELVRLCGIFFFFILLEIGQIKNTNKIGRFDSDNENYIVIMQISVTM